MTQTDEARTPVTSQRVREIADRCGYHSPTCWCASCENMRRDLRQLADQLERNAEVLRQALYGKDHTVLGNGHCIKYRARSIELWHKDPNFDVVKAAQEIQALQEKSHAELVNLSHALLPKPPEAKC